MYEKLNNTIAGTGYQFYQNNAQIMVENEDGLLLSFQPNIETAIKKYIPNGCGHFTVEKLLKLAQK